MPAIPPPPPKPQPPPQPKISPTLAYNPYGYVPGGSTTKVSQAIEAQALSTPGPKPVTVPSSILKGIPLSTPVTTTSGGVTTLGASLAALGELTSGPSAPPPSGPGPDYASEFLDGAVPLAHKAAFDAIVAACDLYGIEAKAACADGLHEGFHGGIGDGGTAYGPWQEHLTDGRIWQIAGLAPYDDRVQRWAWSAKGIEHGVKGMADDSPSARGLHGHEAVHAIVYGFERPRDEAGAYVTRAREYDHLVSLGAAWEAYVIANLIGTGLPGAPTSPLAPIVPSIPSKATGAAGAWGELMHSIGTKLPGLGKEAKRVGSGLPGV